MNPPISFFRLLARLGLLCPWLCAGSPSVVSGPANLEVTFPSPLPTTDLYGNSSATNSRVIYYQTNVQRSEITLLVNGHGTITPMANGQSMVVGQIYQITAVPSDGYHLDHWSGSSQSTDPVLRFVAREGLSFTAHFSANPRSRPRHGDREGRLTFNSLTNAFHRFPIYGADSDEIGRLIVTGPAVTLLTGWNPNNRTPALRLDSSVASNYVITLSGIRAPFALREFEVVSASGSFTLMDEATGAYYTYDGSIGRVKLGPSFRRSEYVVLTVNGQVVLDNIEYRLLEHAPVASVRVWHELRLPPITAGGGTLFDYQPPSHLEDASFYQYPGYRGFWHYLLAPDTNAIPFVVDASGSRDPDHEALKFSWSTYSGGDEGDYFPLMGGVPASSPFFKNRSGELRNSARYKLVLTVQDGYLADRLWFGVVVLAPRDAAHIMWDWLQEHFDSENDPRNAVRGRLIPLLQQAESQFANGQTQAGRRTLKEFQQLASAYLRRLDWRTAETMVAFTDALLEATRKQAGSADGR